MNNLPKQQGSGILVIGDAGIAFGEEGKKLTGKFEICHDTLEAIGLVKKRCHQQILVVMSSFRGRLREFLLILRKTSEKSRIILLAQMHEEAAARDIVEGRQGKLCLADDYYICPLGFDDFIQITENQKISELHVVENPDDGPKKQTINSLMDRINKLEKLATEDDLTGLKNRRYVLEFLRQMVEYSQKKQANLTLLIFDIDDFKRYNDLYGHTTGDNVLRQAAAMMRRCCRNHDIVGRIGGDEFAVVFWDKPEDYRVRETDKKAVNRRTSCMEHPKDVYFLAERFRMEVSSAKFSFLGAGGEGSLTISGGLVSFPKDGQTAEELFEKADKAMLQVKKGGKNRIYLVGKGEDDPKG